MNTCALGSAARDGARPCAGTLGLVVTATGGDSIALPPAPAAHAETLDIPVSNVSLPIGSGRSGENSIGGRPAPKVFASRA
jgi:hypothetical protein